MTGEETRGRKLSDEEVVQFGQLAANAFNNPIFRIWYDLEMTRTIQVIDSAEPDHTKSIMWQKCKRDVLREMASDFTGMVQQAERIYAEMQHQNSPEAKEQQRLDEQGFGIKYGQQRSAS